MPEEGRKEEGPDIGLLDLLFPFFLPIKGLVWIGQKLEDTAEEDLTDTGQIQKKLLELQMKFEMDEISEEEYDKKEAKLMAQLEAIRKYKEEKAKKG
ncbi:MAG: gas vesicle protein GvpG [bacterium]